MAAIKGSRINALEDYFVFRASLDSLGIWTISANIAEELSLGDRPGVVRELTFKVVSDLLERELVRPGFPNAKGEFEAWPYGAREAMARIEGAWGELGGSLPEVGEVVWFETTERGDKHVEGYSPEESGLKLEQVE